MKILFIHNSYSEKTPTGEEHASRELASLLEEHGHEVRWFKRNSDDIRNLRGSIKAFITGIYNPRSARDLERILDAFQPDIVQVQNIYPLISSSIFLPLKKRQIPVVMRCPNYRLFCPAGLCLDKEGRVCELCSGNRHEWWCVRKNCEKDIKKSIGYAVRNTYNRISRRILDGVDIFIVQSEFQKNKFVNQGIPEAKLSILPGISPQIKNDDKSGIGNWVSFVGRVSSEKGIDEFIEAARMNPDIPFKVAGFFDANFVMPSEIPDNLEFVGFKKGDELNQFYLNSRIIVVPSKWYEGFPNVILRAFMLERPVITTNIGAMPSILENEKNGLLVDAGDADALANAIRKLYPDIRRCIEFGKSGRIKAETSYSREQIYKMLMDIYARAIEFNK